METIPHRSSSPVRRPSRGLLPGRGFTIAELMVTLAVVGVLALLALPLYDTVKDNSAKRTLLETASAIARNADVAAGSAGVGDTTDAGLDASAAETAAGLGEGPWAWDASTNTLTFDQGSRCFQVILGVDHDGDGAADTGVSTPDGIDDTALVGAPTVCAEPLPASVPGAPGQPSGVPANLSAHLSWTTPVSNGGAAITDYQVEVSSGGPWTVFNDGVSSAPNATVTGLTNGVAYQFRVSAVNSAGTGASSAASAAVTPAGTMILTVNTALSAGNVMSLPLRGNVNATIDWGDGGASGCTTSVVNPALTTNTSCTYVAGGTYTISITGSVPQFGAGATYTGADKITEVVSWGDLGTTSFNGAFWGANKITSVPAYLPVTVTDLSNMFRLATTFNDPDVASWDISNVTTLQATFREAAAFNQPIGSWDTSNVTTIDNVFRGATVFNQPLDSWDVSNVTIMSGALRAPAFNQPLNSWDVSNVTAFNALFDGATSFNQALSGWNTSQATNMAYMFNNTSFNQNISGWNTGNVTTMAWMFSGNAVFNQPIGSWNVSKVTSMHGMFRTASAFNQPIASWDVLAVTSMNSMFNGASAFNQDISGWETGQVLDMSSMFLNASTFNRDLSGWCVSSVTNYSGFDTSATAYTLPRPVWGTCPP